MHKTAYKDILSSSIDCIVTCGNVIVGNYIIIIIIIIIILVYLIADIQRNLTLLASTTQGSAIYRRIKRVNCVYKRRSTADEPHLA